MSPPSAWPRELVVEARRTLLAMPVALGDAVSAGDFPGALLDSREGIYVASLFVAALVPFVRRAFVDLVAEPSAKRFMPGYKPQRGIATRQSKLSKWKESAWKLFVYTTLTLLAAASTFPSGFFLHTPDFWKGCTKFPPCNYQITRPMGLVYALELGYYFQSVPSLLFFDVKRKDFSELLAHHVATIGLVVYSLHVNFTRVGVMVFLCHDVNDIFLEAAKLARYARTKTAPTALFICFALSWFVSRLFYFPKYIIASVWVDPVELVAKPNNIDTQPHWGFLVGLLCFLLVLHAYWSILILKVIRRNLKEGQPDDVRESDSEDENGEEGEEGGTKRRTTTTAAAAARKKRS